MIRELFCFDKQTYEEHYDELVESTIRLQRLFSAYICIQFLIYTILARLVDYAVLGIENPMRFMGLVVSCEAAVNWALFHKRVFSNSRKYLIAGNAFLLFLMETLVITRTFAEGGLSNTLIGCVLVSTAVINLQPRQYLAIMAAITVSEMTVRYISCLLLDLPFVFGMAFWVDAWLISITAVAINIIISSLRYNLEKEKLHFKRESITDPLTGAYTRRYFEQFFLLHHREDELSALIHIDLDDFKKINDIMGHRKGDEALVYVANILQKQFRKTDCVARIGGDEFMVFMASLTDRKPVTDKIRNILELFPVHIEGGEAPISISIGVAFSEKGKTPDYHELYEMADAAMYQAKKSGKDKAVVWGGGGIKRDL